MKIEWNYEEFCAFLLLYASYADLDFSKSEKELILTKVNKETFDKIEKVYLESSDYERLEIILDHKGVYYPTHAQRMELLGELTKLFKADGDYSKLEKNLMIFLEKLL